MIDVALAGVGAVTAFGVGWPGTLAAIRRGELAPRPPGDALPGAPAAPLALVPPLTTFRDTFPKLRDPLPERETQMLLLAAREAACAAALELDPPRHDVGVTLDRAAMPGRVATALLEPVLRGGLRRTSPLLFSQSVSNAPAGAVARLLGARGPHLVTMGGGALLLSFEALRRGEAEAVLACGLEELCADRLRADEENGLLREAALGEAAVCLALVAGGSPGLPRVCGVAQGGLATDADAIEACVEAALTDAGADLGAISLVVGGEVEAVGAEDEALARLGWGGPAPVRLKAALGETRGAAALLSMAYAAATMPPAASALVIEFGWDTQVTACVLSRAP